MATTKKTPSAAEVARREAQSKKDTGKLIPVIVDGISIEVDPSDVDDFDAMVQMENGDFRPMLNLIIPDEDRRNSVLESLREDSGKLRYSAVAGFVKSVFEEIGKGN